MLTMKEHSKREKNKLRKTVKKREDISTQAKFGKKKKFNSSKVSRVSTNIKKNGRFPVVKLKTNSTKKLPSSSPIKKNKKRKLNVDATGVTKKKKIN